MKAIYLCLILIALSAVRSQDLDSLCTNVTPEVAADCFAHSDNSNYCCYQVSQDQTKKSCVLENKTTFYQSSVVDTTTGMYTDCGSGSNEASPIVGRTFPEYTPSTTTSAINLDSQMVACGRLNPIHLSDCSDYGMLQNSCCYFANAKNQTGCYQMGVQYIGEYKWGDITVMCSGSFSSVNLFAYLLLAFLAYIFI